MRPLALLISAAIMVACSSPKEPELSQVSKFSELRFGDKITVIYLSQGCFSNGKYELVIRNHTLSAYSTLLKKEYLGEIPINKKDIQGLDELIKYYRTLPSGNSTNHDEITLIQYRSDKIIAREKFIDESSNVNKLYGVTTFSNILSRFTQK